MNRRFSTTLMCLVLALPACNGIGKGRHSEWDNLDYRPVYRAYGGRDNDPLYTQPSGGCLDDDLYNCN